jgi:hypothetical protein
MTVIIEVNKEIGSQSRWRRSKSFSEIRALVFKKPPSAIVTNYWPAAMISLGVAINLAWVVLITVLLANLITQFFL